MKRKVYPPNVWRTRLILLAFILAVAAPSRQAIAYYKIIDLGTLPSGRSSWASSINNLGQIVGEALGSSLNYRATLFDPTGGGNNIDLGTLGGPSSEAYSINNHRQIVGWADDSSGRDRATLFDPTGAGKNIDLGTLGGVSSWVRSINNRGQIVGWAEKHSNIQRAVLFDPTGSGNNIDLGTLGENWSYAYSINDYGQIVGSENLTATLFDPTGSGNNIDLGTLDARPYSEAYSINNQSQIVGCAFGPFISIPLKGRAILFDSTGIGNNVDLGTLGGKYSEAYSINNQGQIVGCAYDDLRNYRATLFDPTGGGNNTDLNTLIDPSLGWTLRYAYSINDNGWIVGSGINPAGYDRAYLLIPEPATLTLFVLAGLAILRKRRK
jgi:probable HAF family extracellular repeat protein